MTDESPNTLAIMPISVERIEKVWRHPNADKLDLAKLVNKSFQFVVGRDTWKEGDLCLYFPVDSVIPDELMLKLGVADKHPGTGKIFGKLAGPNKNRLKTVKLRQEYSQGLIGSLDLLARNASTYVDFTMVDAMQLGELLGVRKYEAPAIPDKNGILLPLPLGLSRYDIEGADWHEDVLASLMDEGVVITEKLEGMNFSVAVQKGNEVPFINQRNFTIKEKGDREHFFWTTAKKQGLIEAAFKMREAMSADYVVLYGEMIGPGVQKNIYALKENEVRLFDIMVDGRYLGIRGFVHALEKHGLERMAVPVIAIGHFATMLNGMSIQEFSNGESMLFKTAREGVVIKPQAERYDETLGGRLILKQRSPKYLGETEF